MQICCVLQRARRKSNSCPTWPYQQFYFVPCAVVQTWFAKQVPRKCQATPTAKATVPTNWPCSTTTCCLAYNKGTKGCSSNKSNLKRPANFKLLKGCVADPKGVLCCAYGKKGGRRGQLSVARRNKVSKVAYHRHQVLPDPVLCITTSTKCSLWVKVQSNKLVRKPWPCSATCCLASNKQI